MRNELRELEALILSAFRSSTERKAVLEVNGGAKLLGFFSWTQTTNLISVDSAITLPDFTRISLEIAFQRNKAIISLSRLEDETLTSDSVILGLSTLDLNFVEPDNIIDVVKGWDLTGYPDYLSYTLLFILRCLLQSYVELAYVEG